MSVRLDEETQQRFDQYTAELRESTGIDVIESQALRRLIAAGLDAVAPKRSRTAKH